jgi:hypothetical protein
LARYPKNPDRYADPKNWKYPVHTPFHARAARRYFSKPANRERYTPEERAYIDGKIAEALERFGIAARPDDSPSPLGEEADEGPAAGTVARMTRDELLLVLLGQTRLRRARAIDASSAFLSERSERRIVGKVKDYDVVVRPKDRTIRHDCADWRRSRARGKLFCKHVGRLFLYLPEGEATELLRTILRDRRAWTFA